MSLNDVFGAIFLIGILVFFAWLFFKGKPGGGDPGTDLFDGRHDADLPPSDGGPDGGND